MVEDSRAWVLGATCGFLCDSCGNAELSRREADNALEVMGEFALIRKADAHCDLCQGDVTVELQELLRQFDAARNNVLVRGHPGGLFELSREVVDAEVGGRGHLLQGQASIEVFLNLLDDGAEPPSRQPPPPPHP